MDLLDILSYDNRPPTCKSNKKIIKYECVKAKPAVFQKELHYTSKTLVLILWQFK
jgi:hypothetical protein